MLGGPLVDAGGLLGGEGAHRVGQHAAGAHQLGGGAEQRPLQGGELVDRLGPELPPGVGAAAQHADAAARRVEEHAVEGPGPQWRRAGVAHDRGELVELEPLARGRDHADPAGVDVDGDHRALGADQLGDGGGLAPGRGGEVGDALPRHRGERVHHRLAALVLRGGPAFADRVEPGGIADPAHDERVGHQRPRSTSAPASRSSSVSASAVATRGLGRSVTARARSWRRARRARRLRRARR